MADCRLRGCGRRKHRGQTYRLNNHVLISGIRNPQRRPLERAVHPVPLWPPSNLHSSAQSVQLEFGQGDHTERRTVGNGYERR